MFTAPLRHFLERALATQVPDLEHAFPACFDWARLCRETPKMVERASEARFDPLEADPARALERRANDTFRFAHVAAIALLCANGSDDEDPEASLDRFARPPGDEEEQRFEQLAAELLGPVEESLVDEEVRLDDRGYDARHLLDQIWPSVEDVLAGSPLLGAGDDEGDGDDGDDAAEQAAVEDTSPERLVLTALARVAVLLAVFRWMAAAGDDDDPLPA